MVNTDSLFEMELDAEFDEDEGTSFNNQLKVEGNFLLKDQFLYFESSLQFLELGLEMEDSRLEGLDDKNFRMFLLLGAKLVLLDREITQQ